MTTMRSSVSAMRDSSSSTLILERRDLARDAR